MSYKIKKPLYLKDHKKEKNNIEYNNIYINNKDANLHTLQKKRTKVLYKIKILEKKLIFTSSMPLKQEYANLKKQDIEILCNINEYLIKI